MHPANSSEWPGHAPWLGFGITLHSIAANPPPPRSLAPVSVPFRSIRLAKSVFATTATHLLRKQKKHAPYRALISASRTSTAVACGTTKRYGWGWDDKGDGRRRAAPAPRNDSAVDAWFLLKNYPRRHRRGPYMPPRQASIIAVADDGEQQMCSSIINRWSDPRFRLQAWSRVHTGLWLSSLIYLTT